MQCSGCRIYFWLYCIDFTLKCFRKTLDKKENFYSDLVLKQEKYIRKDTPYEAYKNYNILPWLGEYYGVPWFLGKVDTYHLLCRDHFART